MDMDDVKTSTQIIWPLKSTVGKNFPITILLLINISGNWIHAWSAGAAGVAATFPGDAGGRAGWPPATWATPRWWG